MKTLFAVMGLGRCGSSLVMQMLAAGGALVTGKAPAFEAEDLEAFMKGGPALDFSEAENGTAIKLLDPQALGLPPPVEGARWVGVWCARNPGEQAASMVKFLRHSGMVPRHGPRKLLDSVRLDTVIARRHVGARCEALLELRFEDVIREPRAAAVGLAFFYESWTGISLNVDLMAGAVLARPVGCYAGMLEPLLAEAWDQAAGAAEAGASL